MNTADKVLLALAATVVAIASMLFEAQGSLPEVAITAQRIAATVLTVFLIAAWRPARKPLLVTFAVAFAIMVVNIHIELAFFMQADLHQRALMAALATAHCAVAVVLARLASSATDPNATLLADWHTRGTVNWTLRIVAAALAYVVLYVVVGAVAYTYTKPYYDEMAGLALQTPSIASVFAAQIIRGVVYALAALMFALTTPRPRSTFIAMGLFAGLGGIAPLIGNTVWPLELRVAHAIEILFQNAPFAVIALTLLKTRAAKPSAAV